MTIDLTGQPQDVAKLGAELGDVLSELFGSDEHKALNFAVKNPQLAYQIARAGHAAELAGSPPPKGPDPTIVNGLMKLFPTTPEDESLKFNRAQVRGPQLLAQEELNTKLPEATPAQRSFAQMMTSGKLSPDELLAAAPIALQEHKKSMALRSSLITASSLLSPEEMLTYKNLVSMAENGQMKPDDVNEYLLSHMPGTAQKIALDVATQQLSDILANRKDKEAVKNADIAATAMSIKLGLVAPGTVYVPDAAKNLFEYRARMQEINAQNRISSAKNLMDRVKDTLHGSALALAATHPEWTGEQIKAELRKEPIFGDLTEGEINEAAYKAPSEINTYGKETSEKARVGLLYREVLPAYAQLKALTNRGERLSMKAVPATLDDNALRIGGFGLAFIGSQMLQGGAGAVGAGTALTAAGLLPVVIGAATIGALTPGAVRAVSKAAMNKEQRQYFSAVQQIVSTFGYTESGKRVQPEEWRRVIDRMIPDWTDDPATVKYKLQVLDNGMNVLARTSGVPEATKKIMIDQFMKEAEDQLSAVGIKKSYVDKYHEEEEKNKPSTMRSRMDESAARLQRRF